MEISSKQLAGKNIYEPTSKALQPMWRVNSCSSLNNKPAPLAANHT